jgi:hypothetical protein
MSDDLPRFVSDLIGRVGGPFSFRFLLQPAMATIYALRDGLRDAREGRPAYFWAIRNDPGERRRLLREGWHAVARVILLGACMDAAYQIIELRWIYPFELVVIVLLLAFVPYLLLRGPVNRIARRRQSRRVPVR